MKEKWKNIKGFRKRYKISNEGRVYDNKKKKLLKLTLEKSGYLRVRVCKSNKPIKCRASRLVALNFIPNPENKATVNHKDGVKANNNVKNLEWNSQSENNKHAWKNGLIIRGKKHYFHKLTEAEVLQIRKLFPTDMGCLYKNIARIFNVSVSAIRNITESRT